MSTSSEDSSKCFKCGAVYLNGVVHVCAQDERHAAEQKLEDFIGDFTLDHN